MGKGLPRSIRRGRLGARVITAGKSLGSPAVGAAATVLAAQAGSVSYSRFFPGAAIWSGLGEAKRITATFGGVPGDIKAIAVTVIGTDAADAPLTEALPVATVDTAGQVTSVGSFKTITEIRIPAHDGTGATTSVGVSGRGDNEVLSPYTSLGIQTIFKAVTITDPAVTRNLIATTTGTNTDVKAIQVIVVGKNMLGAAISETLPVFTVDTLGTVTGSKAFKSIAYIDIPAHDGTGCNTSVGTGAKLGLPVKIGVGGGVLAAYLNAVKEATAPTIVANATDLESNTATLNSTLNGTEVKVDFYG